jgi:hypothetical protein
MMERCIVNSEQKGGLGWLAGERDRRGGGFKQTCRGVRKAWWRKKGSGPLKILGAMRFPPWVSVATGAADESDAATGPRDEMVGEAEERESGPLANGAENGEEVRLSGF